MKFHFFLRVLARVILITVSVSSLWAEEKFLPEARILKWKDGKKAVCLLYFDDGLESHLKNVVPELKKRGIAGTFYIVPGAKYYNKDAWEKNVPCPGIELGNHTYTHQGASDVELFDAELKKTNIVIVGAYPGRRWPRLISYGMIGVPPDKWKLTDDERDQCLIKNHLVMRPKYTSIKPGIFGANGPEIGSKEFNDRIFAQIDKAIVTGSYAAFLFHGVGGDWLVAPVETFTALLDKLDSCREQLWITDPVSYHKYETERSSASVKVLSSTSEQIRLQLSSQTDPALYDEPLTLVTKIPEQWKTCKVTQGTTTQTIAASGGFIQYEALPNSQDIVIQNAP